MRLWPGVEFFEDWKVWAENLLQELAAQEQELANEESEVGKIGEFVELPENYLECDGSTFDGEGFPALAQKLGGTTLPNLSPAYDPAYVVGIKAA